MIAVTPSMIFTSTLYAAFSAAIMAVIYVICKRFFSIVISRSFLRRIKPVFRKIMADLFDFLFVFAVGINLMLVFFIFNDGVCSVYSVLVFIAVYFAIKCILNRIYSMIFAKKA